MTGSAAACSETQELQQQKLAAAQQQQVMLAAVSRSTHNTLPSLTKVSMFAKQRHQLAKVSHLAQSCHQKTLFQLLTSLYEANSMQHSDKIPCKEKTLKSEAAK